MYDYNVGWANDSLKILDHDWIAKMMVSRREDVSDEEVYALIEEGISENVIYDRLHFFAKFDNQNHNKFDIFMK